MNVKQLIEFLGKLSPEMEVTCVYNTDTEYWNDSGICEDTIPLEHRHIIVHPHHRVQIGLTTFDQP